MEITAQIFLVHVMDVIKLIMTILLILPMLPQALELIVRHVIHKQHGSQLPLIMISNSSPFIQEATMVNGQHALTATPSRLIMLSFHV
jgi:hypothetical protein